MPQQEPDNENEDLQDLFSQLKEHEKETRNSDPKFDQYYSLKEYQKAGLIASNYAQIMSGKKPIPVPPEDKRFWESWKHPEDVENITGHNIYKRLVDQGVIKHTPFSKK